MSENFVQVSKEFLAEEEGIKKRKATVPTRPNYAKIRENGGPYSMQAKKTRRDEIFRLYFDYIGILLERSQT